MSAQPIDYTALAQQAGAVSSAPAPGPTLVKSSTPSAPAKVDYEALAKQAGAIDSAPPQIPSATSRALSSYWQQINPVAQYKSIGDTLYQLATHPLQTLSKAGESGDVPRQRAVEDFHKGDYVSGIGHGLDWLLNAVPGVGTTVMKASDQMGSGDVAGGLGTFAGLTTNLIATPKIAGKVIGATTEPDAVANAVAPVANAARKVGDVASAVGTGIKAAAPGVAGGVAMAGAGELLSQVPGMEWPARIGLGYPAARMVAGGIKSGISATSEALANLAAKRAIAADAVSQANKAAQDAASAFRGAPLPTDRQLPPAPDVISAGPIAGPPDTSGPIPTDPVTGRPLDRVPPQEPLPISRQLPPATATPPITAGPITPRADIGTPPVESVPDTSGITPQSQLDPVTGRPLAQGAPAPTATPVVALAVPTTPQGTPELVSLDAIAKGMNGKIFSELSPEAKAMAQHAYDEIHAGPTHVATPAPTPSAEPQPSTTPIPAPEPESPNAGLPIEQPQPPETTTAQSSPSNEGEKEAVAPDSTIPEAYNTEGSGLQVPQQVNARDAIAQKAAHHIFQTGIKGDQISALAPTDQKLFWDNLSQLEGLSKQSHYSMSQPTIDATLDHLKTLENSGLPPFKQGGVAPLPEALKDNPRALEIAQQLARAHMTPEAATPSVTPQAITTAKPTDFGEQLLASLQKSRPQATGSSQAVKTAVETPTSTASAAPNRFPLINVGDKVRLKTGRVVIVKSVNRDGTWEWK